MADRMIVMNAGVAEQIGTPLEVYETPRTLFAAQFIGSPSMNIVDAEVRGGKVWLGGNDVANAPGEDGPVKLGVRPEHLLASDDGPLNLAVQITEPLGANTLFHGKLKGLSGGFSASLPGVHPPRQSGEEMRFAIQPGQAHVFNLETANVETTERVASTSPFCMMLAPQVAGLSRVAVIDAACRECPLPRFSLCHLDRRRSLYSARNIFG